MYDGLNDGFDAVAFDKITNLIELREEWKEDSRFIIIDLEMVCSILHLNLAISKAKLNEKTMKMKTKAIGLEVLYQLSATTNINEALRMYSVKDSTANLAVVNLGMYEKDSFDFIVNKVSGNRIKSIEEVLKANLSREKVIKLVKSFKITQQELDISSLENSIATRIATKDHI